MLPWGGLWYYPDCEKITLLVPFRADNPYRAKGWQWLMRYWGHELPEAELIVCTDDSRPFCKTAALNRGFAKAKGDITVRSYPAWVAGGARRAPASWRFP